ncbi:MAG: diguanylate cyclase, partial [Dermatophilaceae bacterium]
MTARSRGDRVKSAVVSGILHPVGVPVSLAILAVTLLGGVSWVAVHEANNTAQSDAQARVQSNRDAAVRALVRQTDELKRAVATWSADPAVIGSLRAATPEGVARATNQLSILARSQDSPVAFVCDTAGRNVVIYPSQPELLGKGFAFRDWFQGASRTGRPYVSSAYTSAANGHPLVVGVAAPVLDGARRLGYITILWQLDSVRGVAEGSQRDDGVAITVTDQRGQPLTGTVVVDDRGQPQKVTVPLMTSAALAGRSSNTARGGMVQAAGPVPGIGWTVTAALPTSVALASARSFQRSLEMTLGLALLLVLLATWLAWRVARRRVAERSAMRDAETALRASEDRFRRVFDESLNGELLVDCEGDVIRVNDTLATLLGHEPQWFLGKLLADRFDERADRLRITELVQAGHGELRAEMALGHSDGRSLTALVALSWMHEHGGGRVLLAQIEDITARRAAEQRLTELALHDALTGLANRRLLIERCEQAFARARSGRGDASSVAALFIDLDGFKPINDRAGHDTGDQVLIAVANDLQSTLRPTDTVARVGGDEFVVLLEKDDGLAYLRTVAARVTTTIRRQVATGTESLTLSASVGIARVDLAREPEVSPEQLLRRADSAMYRAKERGRDQYDVFDSDLMERT